MKQVGDQLDAVWLQTAEGERIALSAHLDSILVMQLLRYYG